MKSVLAAVSGGMVTKACSCPVAGPDPGMPNIRVALGVMKVTARQTGRFGASGIAKKSATRLTGSSLTSVPSISTTRKISVFEASPALSMGVRFPVVLTKPSPMPPAPPLPSCPVCETMTYRPSGTSFRLEIP